MRPFESRWERFFPYVLGAMFGLSVALLVISIVMFMRIGDRTAGSSAISSARISENIDRERSGAITEATRVVSPAVVSITTLRTALVRPNPFLNSHRLFQTLFQQAHSRSLQGAVFDLRIGRDRKSGRVHND